MSDEGGISYNPNQAIYDIGYFKNYRYYLDRSLMRLHKKTYKYINTKTNEIESFRVYNFLRHLREGITYNAYTQPKNATLLDVHSRTTYKLINKDRIISLQLTASYNQELRLYIYECANTILMKVSNHKWLKSDTGWVRKAYEQMTKISKNGGTQAEIDRAVGRELDK